MSATGAVSSDRVTVSAPPPAAAPPPPRADAAAPALTTGMAPANASKNVTSPAPAGATIPAASPTVRAISPGERMAIEARTALQNLDPMAKNELLLLASEPQTLVWMTEHTELLDRAAAGDVAAARELVSHLPEGSRLRAMMNLSGLAALLAGEEQVEAQIRNALAQASPMLSMAAEQLKKPEAHTIALLATELPIRLPIVLQDFENGKLGTDIIGHMIDRRPSARDVYGLFRYLAQHNGNEPFTIDVTQPTLRGLVERLPLPSFIRAENIESITLGPGDEITLKLKDGLIADAGVISAHVGREFTIDLKAILTPQGSSVTAAMSRLEAFGFVFVGLRTEFTGIGWLDTILDILLKIILFPILLIVAIVAFFTRGASVTIKDGENGATNAEVRILGFKVLDEQLTEAA